jgi:hypothetical protein
MEFVLLLAESNTDEEIQALRIRTIIFDWAARSLVWGWPLPGEAYCCQSQEGALSVGALPLVSGSPVV